jgi:hypothetical protein
MKDDSARDRAMEKLVATRLRAGLKPSGASCPDAAILAAYVERTLAPRERQSCEAHLATCMGCQALVVALVRLSEDDKPVGTRAAAVAPSRAAAASRFRWAWAGGSALAATLVVVIWFSGELRKPSLQPAGTQSQYLNQSANKPSAAPPAPTEEKQFASAPAKPREPSKANRREMKTLDTEADLKSGAEKTPDLEAQRTAESGSAGAPAKDDSVLKSRSAPVPAAPPAAHALLPAPRPATMVTPSERARLAMNKPAEGSGASQGVSATTQGAVAGGMVGRSSSTEKSNDVRAPAAPPPQNQAQSYEADKKASNAPAASSQPILQKARSKEETESVAQADAVLRDQAAGKGQNTQTVVVGATAQMLEVQGESVVRAWRVGRRGLIQEVGPNGQWQKRKSGVKTDLNEISFPSPAVGWVVGHAGTILRSTDGGATWNQLSSPTTENLVHVSAASALAATVVSRSGMTFTTTDGGRTWTSAQP